MDDLAVDARYSRWFLTSKTCFFSSGDHWKRDGKDTVQKAYLCRRVLTKWEGRRVHPSKSSINFPHKRFDSNPLRHLFSTPITSSIPFFFSLPHPVLQAFYICFENPEPSLHTLSISTASPQYPKRSVLLIARLSLQQTLTLSSSFFSSTFTSSPNSLSGPDQTSLQSNHSHSIFQSTAPAAF